MTLNLHKLQAVPAPRDEGGRFAKGSPGRLKGAKGRQSRAALERVKAFGPEALQALHEAIIAKERWAVEYCLNKIIPSNSRTLEWEEISVEDAAEALKSSDISFIEFRELMNGLAKMAELTELETIKNKLEELERTVNDRK